MRAAKRGDVVAVGPPYRDRPGFGTLVESMSGYAARTGFPDREPALPPTALADMVAGLYGAMSVLVALRHREVGGGTGQIIDLPLLDPLFSFIATEAAIYRLTGTVRERTGSRSETTSPRNVFRTKDGRYIGISASIQAMAERLFRAVGREDMITDPRFRTNSDRVRNAEASKRAMKTPHLCVIYIILPKANSGPTPSVSLLRESQ
jgi:crotonobetainyl-CoA:carnitine CoA-transferase CaiB-like acyl-CoA transferase